MRKKLEITKIKERLSELPGWNLTEDNQYLLRKFKFKDWQEVMNFLNNISKIAEEMNHHPNINFSYGWCEVRIQTHDAGGITDLDFQLAKRIK